MTGEPIGEWRDEPSEAPRSPEANWFRRYSFPFIGACLLAGLTIGVLIDTGVMSEFLREFQRRQGEQRLAEYVMLLKNHFAAVQALREAGVSAEVWKQEAERMLVAHKPIVQEMNRTASRREPIRQHILWALRDRFPEMLANGRLEVTEAEISVARHIQQAENLLQASGINPAQ